MRLLRPHGLPLIPDDEWARLARTEPGGFAGVYYDSRHQPTIALARPNEAAAAKVALAGHVPFAMDVAVIQPVRWDFAQLSEWFDYLYPKISMVGVSADKDELLNRIRFGAIGVGTRDSVVRILENVDMPCDLVVVDLSGVIAVAGDRGR